ncbi:MAG: hypothetical protein J1E60_08470 [Christensenellaceae bacterium]|nr:hypothetical protein [Christensenellaceae bacterium]
MIDSSMSKMGLPVQKRAKQNRIMPLPHSKFSPFQLPIYPGVDTPKLDSFPLPLKVLGFLGDFYKSPLSGVWGRAPILYSFFYAHGLETSGENTIILYIE